MWEKTAANTSSMVSSWWTLRIASRQASPLTSMMLASIFVVLHCMCNEYVNFCCNVISGFFEAIHQLSIINKTSKLQKVSSCKTSNIIISISTFFICTYSIHSLAQLSLILTWLRQWCRTPAVMLCSFLKLCRRCFQITSREK